MKCEICKRIKSVIYRYCWETSKRHKLSMKNVCHGCMNENKKIRGERFVPGRIIDSKGNISNPYCTPGIFGLPY